MERDNILLLGTLHDTHKENPHYSFEALYARIEAFKPDLVAVEIREQDMVESNDFLKCHYPPEMVGAKIRYESQIKILGFDWRGKDMERKRICEKDDSTPKLWELAEVHEDLMALIRERKALMEPFFKTCTLEACQKGYKQSEEALIEAKIKHWLVEHQLEGVMAYSQEREARIQNNIFKIIEENPNKRIVILTGRGHLKDLTEFLGRKTRLRVESLKVGYGSTEVIGDMTMGIPNGQVTSIIGSNGCGKSTLLKAIARMIPYQGGQVLLDSKAIHRQPTKLLAKKMAMLSQKMDVVEGLTVRELVCYGRFPHQRGLSGLTEKDYEVVDWALTVTESLAYKDKDIDTLSGGQLQRVWIAMALAQETDIILLDEPTTYLDMAHQLEILALLKKLNVEQGRTIVMVLHDINQAARFSDHMIAMKEGQIIASGHVESVITKEVLKAVYHIEAIIGKDPLTEKPMCLTYTTCV